MEQIPTMVDGLTELAADLFNQIPDETENTITSTGNALSNGDLTQLAKAIASYATRAAFYIDSGVADTYTLTLNGAMKGATSITEGMCIRTVIANTNTGPSTVQPAGLASTTALRMDGSPLEAGDLNAGDEVAFFYIGAQFRAFNFTLISTTIESLGLLAFEDAVDGSDIAPATITNVEIANNTITNLQMANNSIGILNMQDNSISQNELLTGVWAGSYSGSGNNTLVTGGGGFGFYPSVRYTQNVGFPGAPISGVRITGNYTPPTINDWYTTVYLDAKDTGGASIGARQYFIQASPPFDIGDGEIPMFIYAVINTLGEVTSTYAASVPPWAYNGPTDIRGRYDSEGKKFGIRRDVSIESQEDFDSYMVNMSPTPAPVEITMDVKNADMPLIPQPFGTEKDAAGDDVVGNTIVLLDPCETLKLRELHDAGVDIADLFAKNYLKVDNNFLTNRATPCVDTVNIMAIKWT